MAILLEHRLNESKEQQANAVVEFNEYAPWQGAHSNGSCCADRSSFVIENPCCLGQVLQETSYAVAHIHTCPMNFEEMTSLPGRVVAEITQ